MLPNPIHYSIQEKFTKVADSMSKEQTLLTETMDLFTIIAFKYSLNNSNLIKIFTYLWTERFTHPGNSGSPFLVA